MIFRLARQEIGALRRLHRDSQALLASFMLFAAAAPLLGIFSHAFLWRRFESISLVAAYSAVVWLVVLLSFLVNAFLARSLSVPVLYAFGFLAQGLAISALFFAPELSFLQVLLYGALYGFFAGFFWANRNLLTLAITKSSERDYFCNMEMAGTVALSVIMPLLFGWFIELAAIEPATGYRVLMIFVNVLLLLGSILVLRARFRNLAPPIVRLNTITPAWRLARAAMALIGLSNGVLLFLPNVVVLAVVGGEGRLGTAQSAAALCTSLVLYIAGRLGNARNRLPLLAASVACLVVGGLILALDFGVVGAAVLLILQAAGLSLTWPPVNAIVLDLIDHERQGENLEFAYMIQREVALEIGRFAGVAILLVCLQFLPAGAVLRYFPLLMVLPQLALVPLIRRLRSGERLRSEAELEPVSMP